MQPEAKERLGLLATWIALIALTGASFWFAEGRSSERTHTAAVVLGIALVKSHLVAGVFMELVGARRVFGILMSGFLIALAALLVALLS